MAQSITLSELYLDGGHVYWLEGRPQEQGRYVVVRAGADGQPTDVTPPTYNARTRVHEYGGGSWTVRNGTVYFSNFADGRGVQSTWNRVASRQRDEDLKDGEIFCVIPIFETRFSK